jgi:2-dehydropantoate 2-reductase
MQMKICIYGAGAIGGVLGARLAAAGRQTSLIARGAHLAAIRANGLTLRTDQGDTRFDLPVSDRPADFGPQDLVICAAKSHSLPAVAREIAPLLGPDTPVVFAVNGIPWWFFHKHSVSEGTQLQTVDPDGDIWRLVGPRRAIGCIVYMGASTPAPGIAKYHSGGRFVLGEPDNTNSARLQRVAEAMRVDGVTIETTDKIRDEMMAKLIGNASLNPLSALTRSSFGPILGDPPVRRLAKKMMEECQAVGASIGAALKIDVETKLNSFNSNLAFRTSTLQDLEAGRQLEIDALVGVVAELGQITGTPTPTIDTVYSLLRLLAKNLGQYPEAARAH